MAAHSDLPEPENWLSSIKEELRVVRQGLEQNDAEIDALQLETKKANRPWYQDISVMVSVSAFLLSLLTTIFSFYIARQQEIHNNQAELRSVIQRITALNSEYNELVGTQNTQVAGYRSDAILNELILLANQADALMKRMPQGYVSMIEYKAVADAFAQSLYLERAEDMYEKAIDSADIHREKAIALRSYGNFLMLYQQYEKARQIYASALSANQESSNGDSTTALLDDLYTYLLWGANELALGECAKAHEELERASEIATQLKLFSNHPASVELSRLLKIAESCVDS